MRLWSIAPQYLDSKGLVALWREALLAQAVLHGKTKGYKNHPQLTRFRDQEHLLAQYLHLICEEAEAREYNFDRKKILKVRAKPLKVIPVTRGQIEYEWEHLLKKLKTRDSACYKEHKTFKAIPKLFSTFKMTPHKNIEPWEII